MHNPASTTLLADIGGTNARFALRESSAAPVCQAKTLACQDYPRIEDAIDDYLAELHNPKITNFCFAVAGPIQDAKVDFLNNPWRISEAELKTRYKLQSVALLNDFLAIAYALRSFTQDDLMQIGDQAATEDMESGDYCVVGPGSGLGVAGLTCFSD